MVAKQTTQQASPIQRTEIAYKQLSKSASNLNLASDEFGKFIDVLDSTLQRLNLGVAAWVTITGGDDPQTADYWSRDIGYARIGRKWGIALRDRHGNYSDPDNENLEEWLFNESPRWLRIEAVGKVPDLLEALIKRTDETTTKIKSKTVQLQEIAGAIVAAVQEARQENEVPHARNSE